MDQNPLPGCNGDSEARGTRVVEGVLARLPLFAHLQPRELTALARLARALEVRRGTCIVRRGERMPGALSFAYGSAKLSLRRGVGDERVMRFVNRGGTFGMAETLSDAPCRGDLVALADSCVVVLPQGPLLRLLDLHSHFARALAQFLCGEVIELGEEIDVCLQRSALQRLARYLVSLMGAQNGHAPVIRLPASKAVVAARVGITKETMSRMLRELSERKVLTVMGSELTVTDADALTALADSGSRASEH